MSIRVLPPEVVAAIAAGEVVERPASVVKELIENAIDAGARRIRVAIEEGGRGRIEVADDGCGIAAADAGLAFSRHATSKVARLDDLFAIRTLGFRGEALASIGSVARVELVSRAAQAEAGVRVRAEGGQVRGPEPVAAPPGTVVVVRDLFFNVPARQKFLKSDKTEERRIETLVTRYALAYPSIHFALVLDGREAFHSSPAGDVRETLAEIYGLSVAREMIELPALDSGPIEVRGLISPPSVQRSSRRELTFFVNGRWVQDTSLGAAVLQAYQGLLMVGRYPLAVILLTLPPAEVDVNVHPAKAEVRFREPDRVFAVLQRVVRATLLGQAPPSAEFEWPDDRRVSGGLWGIGPDWAAASEVRRVPPSSSESVQPPLGGRVPLLRAVGQVGAAYLVAEGPDGLYLIDQHAAHERILFERYQAERAGGKVEAQVLLEPATVHLPPRQAEMLEQKLDVLRGLGFEVEPFGGGSFRLRSLPSLLTGAAPEAALRAVVEEFEEDEAPLGEDEERRLAARVCKRAAVRSGQVLSLAEQERLLRDLEACQSPRTCPHGRPTMIHLSVEALERQFGRRG